MPIDPTSAELKWSDSTSTIQSFPNAEVAGVDSPQFPAFLVYKDPNGDWQWSTLDTLIGTTNTTLASILSALASVGVSSSALPSGAATSALQSTGNASLVSILAALGGTVVVGDGGSSLSIDDGAGSLTVDGTVTANAGSGTFAVSASSLPLPNGASTSAKQDIIIESIDGVETSLSSLVSQTDGVEATLTSISGQLPSALASDRLKVDGSGVTQPISGSVAVSGTATVTGNKAEDDTAVSGDAGLPILGVRNDTGASKTSANGDYSMIATDSAGRVGVSTLNGTLDIDGAVDVYSLTHHNDMTGSGSITTFGGSATCYQFGSGTLAVWVRGTWTGALTVKGSIDAATFVTLPVVVPSTGALATSITANGFYLVPCAGFAYVYVTGPTSTGTATISIQASSASTTFSLATPLPTGANAIGTLAANSGVDIGDVTINNSSGASAVNVQDGGNSLTVDGTVTANAGSGTFAVSAATLPLPSGASTGAKQDTIIGHLDGVETSLSSIDGKLPSALASDRLKVDGSGVTQPVSGTVTATGPLTDTELRASAVPVSAASLPLPSGAATSANQSTLIGHVDGIESTLSSILTELGAKTEPTDTQSVSGTVAATQSGTWTEANSAAVKTAVELIDDAIYTDGAGTPSKAIGVAGTDGTNPQILKTDASGELQVDIVSSALPSGAATSAKQDTIIGHLDGVEGVLATIDTDTGGIAASVATVAGAVSGAEMQVDIITLPTVTVQDGGGSLTIDGAVTVSGTVAATGPLTDAELRASAVSVSAASLPLPTGAATSANQATLIGHLDGVEGSLSAIDAKLPSALASDRLKVDGSGVTQPVSDAGGSLTVDGTVAATQSGTWTEANSAAIKAAVEGTLAVSAASLPLPSGAATAAKQPALGTAGAASADVLSVQGVASMTALKVDGSAVTQPVSGTVTVQDGGNVISVDDGAGSLTVDGTVAATQSGTWTVQPGNTANTTAWKVDGSAVTQPVSQTSANLPNFTYGTPSQATVTNTAANIVASTTGFRKVVIKVNILSDTGVYLNANGTATSSHFLLGPGEVYTFHTAQAISAIRAGAANVTVYIQTAT